MDSCIIKSPLGFTKITGDLEGIVSITVLNSEETSSETIPESLQDCVHQLQDYFEGTCKTFNIKSAFC